MRTCLTVVVLCAFTAFLSADKSDLGYLPRDIGTVFQVDSRQTEGSVFFQSLYAQAEAGIAKFEKATGLTLKETITLITIAGTQPQAGAADRRQEQAKEPAGESKPAPRPYYVICRGTFDIDAINQALAAAEPAEPGPATTVENYLKNDIYSMHNGALAFSFPDKGVLVIGTLDCVKQILEVKARKSVSALKNEDLAAVLPPVTARTALWSADLTHQSENTDINAGENTGRGAGRGLGGRRSDDAEALLVVQAGLRNYLNAGMAADITVKKEKGEPVAYISLMVYKSYESANTANRISTAIRQVQNLKNQAVGAGLMNAATPLVAILDALKASTSSNILKLQFEFSQEEFEKLAGPLSQSFLKGLDKGLPGRGGTTGGQGGENRDAGQTGTVEEGELF